MPRRGCVAGLLAGLAVLATAPSAYAVDPAEVPGDAVAPTPVSVEVSPDQVNVADEAAAVVVTARVTDDHSGVASVVVRLGDGAEVALSPLAGDSRNGDWSGTATVPQATSHGLVTAFVEARDTAGNVGTRSEHVTRVVDVPPSAPASIAAEPRDRALHVTWEAPPANGGSPVSGYTVTAEAVTSEPAAPVVVNAAADAREATLPGLGDGVRYVVRVAATNPVGTGAAATADATVGQVAPTTPSIPRALVAVAADRAANVTWVAPASDGGSPVTGYAVRAAAADGTSVSVPVAATATTALVPGLVNGTVYDVTVTALNDRGAGLAAATRVRPRTVPGRPAIAGVSAADRSVTVRWNAPTSDGGDPIHTYVVTAHPTGTRYVVGGAARSAFVGGLVNGAAYTFSVAAHNDAGAGPSSAPSAVTTPRQPVRLVVTAKPGATVTHGSASFVTARLTSLIGTPIPGRKIELQAQVKPSTDWRTVYVGATDPTGTVHLRAALPATSGLRVRHPGGALATAHAWVSSVVVAQRVTATPSVTSLVVGRTLVVTGAVAPNHPVGSRVTLQRNTSRGWVNVADGAMTTNNAYRIAWRTTTSGVQGLRVVKHADHDHASGVSAMWRQTVMAEGMAELARQIKANPRISLDAFHTSGRVDGANARANIADLAAGLLARRSAYEGAPGGTTRVDTRLLRALKRMGERGGVTVSEIAGGSHSRGSTHYSGRGLDIRAVGGVPVRRGTSYGMAVEACRAFGAVRVFHPSYDPYGGHQGHVHCDWA